MTHKIKFESLESFLSKRSKQPTWLIDGLVPSDAIVLLTGHKKRARKTLLSMTIGLCYASGKSFGEIKPVGSGPVLMIEEEGAIEGTQERLRGLSKMVGVESSGWRDFKIAHRQGIKIDDPEHVDAIAAQIKFSSTKLIILDGFTYLLAGDENRKSDVLKFVDGLNEFRRAGASVMLICHLDKASGKTGEGDMDDQVRGSGVITDSYDSHIALRQWGSKPIKMDVRHRDHSGSQFSVEWAFSPYNLTIKAMDEEDQSLNNVVMFDPKKMGGVRR